MKALERLDVMIAARLGSYYQSVGSSFEPDHLGNMQVDLRFKPPFDEDSVLNSQTYLIQLPALAEDFQFLGESSDLAGVLDAVLSADVHLCMAPKSGLYDLSSYEVCSRLRFDLLVLIQLHSLASLPTFLRLHIAVASPRRMHLSYNTQG